MKAGKIIIGIAVFAALNVLCAKALRFALDDDAMSYTRYTMHDLYTQEQNIDVLFLGTSHCQCSMDPAVTDAVFAMNTFNAGSQSQDLDASLALLKEADARYDISRVYLEMYYAHTHSEEYSKRTDMERVWLLSDYMKPSLNKLDFMFHGIPKEYYVLSTITARRNWEDLLNPERVGQIIGSKLTDDYRNYRFRDPEGRRFYGPKGFIYVETSDVPDDVIPYTAPFEEERVQDCWRDYLHRIISYCKEHGIRLTLFSAPIQDYHISAMGNYDSYIALLKQELEGTGVEYYDFNLCREQMFSNDEALYRDYGHLNKKGADLFSEVFAEFFTGKIKESDLFYPSYEEKMRHADPAIFCLMREENDPDSRLLTIVSTSQGEMEYRISLRDEKGNAKLLRDYSTNRQIGLPVESGGMIVIDYRYGDQTGSWETALPDGL